MKSWDTSAVLSLLLRQNATGQLKKALSADGSLALWWATKVEAISAVCRLSRSGEATKEAAAHVLAEIEALTAAAHEIQSTEDVRSAAYRVLRVHESRAADTLQLGAGLIWAEHRPAGMGFVCLDARLREAAAKEGFAVLPALG